MQDNIEFASVMEELLLLLHGLASSSFNSGGRLAKTELSNPLASHILCELGLKTLVVELLVFNALSTCCSSTRMLSPFEMAESLSNAVVDLDNLIIVFFGYVDLRSY